MFNSDYCSENALKLVNMRFEIEYGMGIAKSEMN